MSGGEKQKIAIIRSIINKPDILFLDESFSSMDEKNEIISLNLLNKVLKNTTIILITHKNKVMPKFSKIIDKNRLHLYFNH